MKVEQSTLCTYFERDKGKVELTKVNSRNLSKASLSNRLFFMTLSFWMNFFRVPVSFVCALLFSLLWQMVLPIKQKPKNKNSHTKFAICAQKSLLEFGNLILMCKNYCHCTWSSLQIFRKNPENRFRDMPKPENNYLFWVQQ